VLHARYRLPLALAAAQATGCLVCAGAYRATGLRVAWTTIPATFPLIAIALLWWVLTIRRARADAALAIALILSCSTLVLFVQYPALALGRPMVDTALLRADAALGISVPALAIWTSQHQTLVAWLQSAYSTLILQLLVALAMLAARRDRDALWEFVTHYHVCLASAVAVCAVWPATEPWAVVHLPDFAEQARAATQIAGFHDWTMRVVDVSQPAGLVAMPSFHVAAAWMATWAVRKCRPALVAFVALNVLLTASTVLLGVHYAVDVVAGIALLAVSVGGYALVARRRLAAIGFESAEQQAA
jgi:membrane-associated phospholipid phosphatase